MFAAAIFALHPVNVESVAWIAQLKGILALVLALISVLFYLSYERHEDRWRFVSAIFAFLLSALAKGTALTLPVVLLACAWWQRGRIQRRDLLRVLPYLLIGAAMAGVEVLTQHNVGGEVARSDGFFSRAAIAGCAVWFYLGKLIWPVDLCPVYPRWPIGNLGILWCLPSLMWIVLLACAWRRRRTWGQPVLMLVVCYVALLLPVLGFVNIAFMQHSLVADHWQYIATIVPCAMFAGISVTLARRFLHRPAAISASVALLVVLAVLSWRQSRMYADAEAFYATTIARNPDCWMAQNNVGRILADRGQIDAAFAHFQKALEINPDYAEADNNLGNILRDRGQIDAAFARFQKALEINPDYAEAHINLGNVLRDRGQADAAIAQYRKALEIKPDAEAHYNFGSALFSRGQIDAALAHYQKALEINPDFAEAHCGLGVALAARGELDAAIAHYQKALEIKPDYAEAHYNLGTALHGRGQLDAAVDHYQKALEINPNYAEAHNNLGAIMVGRGQIDKAIVHFRRALEIKPDYEAARQNLAAVLSEREKILKSPADLHRQPPSR
jgi:tetratricopeptide (TPR) repeat protein